MIWIPEAELDYKEIVGKGSFGEVWRTLWLGRGGGVTVAVKKIATAGLSDAMKKKVFKEVDIPNTKFLFPSFFKYQYLLKFSKKF